MFDALTPAPALDGPRRLLVDPPARIMSRADCEALFKRVVGMTTGGDTSIIIQVNWTGSLRWARNRPTMASDTTEYNVTITRAMPGKVLQSKLQELDDASLKEAVHTMETRLEAMEAQGEGTVEMLPKQEYLPAACWDDATYKMTVHELSEAVRVGVDPVQDAKLTAAGYAALSAVSWAIFNTRGMETYAAATGGMYSETVRNLEGSASGWSGKAHTDWAKLDVQTLAATALKKCRDSTDPVKLEPGRYTTILEPKATAILMWCAVNAMDRADAENNARNPFNDGPGVSKIGLPVFDSRITISADPTDPECSFIPFDSQGNPYRKVTWVENGILKELPYDRNYARSRLDSDVPLLNPFSFRMSGGTTSVEEMISTTERGIYVTHFGRLDPSSPFRAPRPLNHEGYTHDGLWLIEHGKIVRAIKNFWINDSPLVVFNQVAQLGPSVRTQGIQRWGFAGQIRNRTSEAVNDGFSPVVAPPAKVKDFAFTRLMEAI